MAVSLKKDVDIEHRTYRVYASKGYAVYPGLRSYPGKWVNTNSNPVRVA
jgi:outer membrane usher protein FimD/PapC